MLDINSLPDYEAVDRMWKDLFEQQQEETKETSAELENKTNKLLELQNAYNALFAYCNKLEGQVEAYKFSIELLAKRNGDH